MKILLIDDEQDFTELTSTLLKFNDFDVEVLNDPIEVRRLLDSSSFDLIVTDLMMPGMDGFELIRNIRALPPYKDKPIFVLSAKTLNDEERKFLLQNRIKLISKPFEPQGLVDEISLSLNK